MKNVILLCILVIVKSDDVYDEELLLTRLPSGNQLAQFRFVIKSGGLYLGNSSKFICTYDSVLGPDYVLFPRLLGEFVNKYAVRELFLSMTQGTWRSEVCDFLFLSVKLFL